MNKCMQDQVDFGRFISCDVKKSIDFRYSFDKPQSIKFTFKQNSKIL